MPKVSIIMPMLNSIKYLKECMDSVINQTLIDIEIIPVDAGSTDGTLELLEEYANKDNRIKILHSDKKSMGYQYNLGMEIATGDYIGFVESDDYVVANMFETLWKYAEKYQVEWVKANYNFFMQYPTGRQMLPVGIIKKCGYDQVFRPSDYPTQIYFDVYMWPGIYRTSFIREHKIKLNETPGASFQDAGFVLQSYMYAERAMYIDEYLYCYRRDNQASSAHQVKAILFGINEVEYMSDIIKKDENLYKHFWGTFYKKSMSFFLDFYKRLPVLSECNSEIYDALIRWCNFFVGEMERDELFWSNNVFAHFGVEMSFLQEGIEAFDCYYRRMFSEENKNLRKTINKILERRKIVIFGCGNNGLGILSLLLRLNKK